MLEPTITEKQTETSVSPAGTGTISTGAGDPTNLAETSSNGAVLENEPAPTEPDPDQVEEFVKTGEYYAITFALLLLVTGLILLLSRIRLAKDTK